MLRVTEKIGKAIDRNSIVGINKAVNRPLTVQSMTSGAVNRNTMIQQSGTAVPPMRSVNNNDNISAAVRTVQKMAVPQLMKQVQKGQKVAVTQNNSAVLDVRFGWNVRDERCDIDVSAFMLGENGRVIGDDWFVFYGQQDSPDKSVHFSDNAPPDREEITVSLPKLNEAVKKIVFVMTLYDAAAKGLNFSMISDAYIRILDHSSGQEIVSFKISEYYLEVLSMMIGELYLHNGVWKFGAVGNGVAKELNGLCALYGVNTE